MCVRVTRCKEMSFTRIRDICMYYEVHGIEPHRVLISGSSGDLRRKSNIFDAPVVKHYKILAYDQRGLGQTDKSDTPYTMIDYADDANALLEIHNTFYHMLST